MTGIPPELTSSALTALAVLGAWFGTWLARKGKREDNKIAQSNQSFVQLQSVADERMKDNDRLRAELVTERTETERLRAILHARWELDHPPDPPPAAGVE